MSSNALFAEDAALSPMYIFGVFVKNQIVEVTWNYIWVHYSIALIYLSAFVLGHAIFITMSL